jgi:hypothetical protein
MKKHGIMTKSTQSRKVYFHPTHSKRGEGLLTLQNWAEHLCGYTLGPSSNHPYEGGVGRHHLGCGRIPTTACQAHPSVGGTMNAPEVGCGGGYQKYIANRPW